MTKCPSVSGSAIIDRYSGLLSDESRTAPETPQIIFFPSDTEETSSAVQFCAERKLPLTVSGGRTGITAGAVSLSNTALISLENMVSPPRLNFSDNNYTVTVSAGFKLSALNDFLLHTTGNGKIPDLFFPVDPTETSASIGGIASTNASGARTYHYGAARSWITGLTIVLADGKILRITRGQYISRNGVFQNLLFSCQTLSFSGISIPATKHAAGYQLKPEMDLIDLFIGSEGTLGIITEVTLKLTFPVESCLYLTVFSRLQPVSTFFTTSLIESDIDFLAIEYMDSNSVSLLNSYREEAGDSSGVPCLPPDVSEVYYLEIPLKSGETFLEKSEKITDLLARFRISPEMTWAGLTRREMMMMKKMRHALPERVNMLLTRNKMFDSRISKVSTDMAVPVSSLSAMTECYRDTLISENLKHCIFGHIGNGHLHVNIIPSTYEEYTKSRELYRIFAEKAVALGGSIAAEHGIGRNKKYLLPVQYSPSELSQMKAVRDFFDPHRILNPGVLFD